MPNPSRACLAGLFSGLTFCVGFLVGHVMASQGEAAAPEEQAQAAVMPRGYVALLERFELVARDTAYGSLAGGDQRFRNDAIGIYEVECLFSVTDENRDWCERFEDAIASHNTATRLAQGDAVSLR